MYPNALCSEHVCNSSGTMFDEGELNARTEIRVLLCNHHCNRDSFHRIIADMEQASWIQRCPSRAFSLEGIPCALKKLSRAASCSAEIIKGISGSVGIAPPPDRWKRPVPLSALGPHDYLRFRIRFSQWLNLLGHLVIKWQDITVFAGTLDHSAISGGQDSPPLSEDLLDATF